LVCTIECFCEYSRARRFPRSTRTMKKLHY
jgi:hypothetical protein